MFRSILLSYDGSDHSKHALKTAAAIAKAFGAELHVTHTPQVDTPRVVVGAFVSALDTPPTSEQITEAAEHIGAEVREQAKAEGVTVADYHVGRGDPASHTLSVAEKINADMIVMGRRGLGAVGALALGSVSQAVAHRTKCACLTVG